MSQKPSRQLWILKLVVGAGLLTVLMLRAGLGEALSVVAHTDVALLLAAFLVPHLGILVSVLKWQMLLRSLATVVSIRRLTVLYLIGTFFNNLLPSTVGGDVVRVYQLGREQGALADVAAATFMERAIGFVALVCLVPAGILGFHDADVTARVSVVVTLAACVVAVVAWRLMPGVTGPLARFARVATTRGRLGQFLSRMGPGFARYRACGDTVLAGFGISIVFYLLAGITVWLVCQSVGVQVGLGQTIRIVPLVLLVGMIPISVNGLGLIEGGYVAVLATLGVPSSDALAVALLLRMRVLLTAGLGAVCFIAARRGPPERSAASRKQGLPAP